MEPQCALHHAPTGSWRLLTDIDKGEPAFEVFKNVCLWPLGKGSAVKMAVPGQWPDSMSLEVPSNLHNSMIL